ncbi:MAG: deoxyribose-phosphate aldolase [Bacteroidales bacterium]|nr:deoxyribose-phosphate aldolase [Bacteroidales bacterium]MBN2817421.1 deoxyribose-phosphate aldolase [Bacteroidales bacterium]
MKKTGILLNEILDKSKELNNSDNLKLLYSCIDLTNLNSYAKKSDIDNLCTKARLIDHKGIAVPRVAAVCIYPLYIELCKKLLNETGIQIATVTADFPHAQTFSEVKYLETELALKHGADEIDIVLNLSAFLNGETSVAFDEIKTIKQICGEKHLKVILETGILQEKSLIHEASVLAIEAGADFIKTSTGKDGSVASTEAAFIMCKAISENYKNTGKRVGLKPAGGISTSGQALDYLAIIYALLGDDWLTPELFRIGASRLAGNLLDALKPK